MSKKNKALFISIIIFCVVQILTTTLIAIIEIKNLFNANSLRFVSIIACFLFSWLGFKKKNSCFIIGGLAFTLLADYFLLIIRNYYVLGICSFLVTQTFYFVYIWPKHLKISLITRGTLFLLILTLLLIFGLNDITVIIAAFYFINLVVNTIDAYISINKGLLFFAIGLTLFILCDIFVFLYNCSDYIRIESEFLDVLIKYSLVGCWIFYIPSQALITISSILRSKLNSAAYRK
ncbi:MAG: hypothetical protein K6E21_01535 [Bacilli bacterium]|nr:hypothetical protein [Bacilli bacterium]